MFLNSRSNIDPCRIKSLEDEQEMLSSSLLALTSHFAQVQFRLRQIVDSAPEERDGLLQSLEEFAFRGIPEVTKLDVGEHEHLFKAMERQRARQFELIDQLKKQLTDVEKFAYDSGSKVLPQSVLVEKQKVIIDELKNKLNLNVCDDDLPQLTTEELRCQVDNALVELVGPIKMKDTLVGQLKTQIVDLERFVAYLQCETYDLKKMTKAMGGFKNCESAYSTYNSKMAKNRQAKASLSSTDDLRNELRYAPIYLVMLQISCNDFFCLAQPHQSLVQSMIYIQLPPQMQEVVVAKAVQMRKR